MSQSCHFSFRKTHKCFAKSRGQNLCWCRKVTSLKAVEQKTVGNQLLLTGVCLAPTAALGTRHDWKLQVQWEAHGSHLFVSAAPPPLITAAKPNSGSKHGAGQLFHPCSLWWNRANPYSPGDLFSCFQTRITLCQMHPSRGKEHAWPKELVTRSPRSHSASSTAFPNRYIHAAPKNNTLRSCNWSSCCNNTAPASPLGVCMELSRGWIFLVPE